MKTRDMEIQAGFLQHNITIEYLPHGSDMPYRIIVGNNPVNFVDPNGLLVMYRGGGAAGGWGYKVNPKDADPVTYASVSVVHFGGSSKSGGTKSGIAYSGGVGRMFGLSAGGGAIVGVHFGDVEDLSGHGTSTGILIGPFAIELTLDGEGQSVTGFSIGLLGRGGGIGVYGQETLTGTVIFNSQETQTETCGK